MNRNVRLPPAADSGKENAGENAFSHSSFDAVKKIASLLTQLSQSKAKLFG